MSLANKKGLETNASILNKYIQLDQRQVLITYIWIDGRNGLRSKTKTVSSIPKNVTDLPIWNFDGSSTYQSTGKNADVYLLPIRMYRDPFRGGNNKLVLCETVDDKQKATMSNTRHSCKKIMDQVKHEEPWFGIEQEYFMLDAYDKDRPLGWSKDGNPSPMEPYYLGLGANRNYGRIVSDLHLRACLYAGIKVAGTNAEGSLGQWEYQVGPCKGIEIGDDLWMSRYILERLAEDLNIAITYEPKVGKNVFGSGAHTNFSTKSMREPGGLKHILEAMPKLERNHKLHMAHYDLSGGADNSRRLAQPSPVTAPMDQFSFGIGDRAKSIRIPRQVSIDGCGYLEDRRPASNIDPYIVSELLIRTICLDDSNMMSSPLTPSSME